MNRNTLILLVSSNSIMIFVTGLCCLLLLVDASSLVNPRHRANFVSQTRNNQNTSNHPSSFNHQLKSLEYVVRLSYRYTRNGSNRRSILQSITMKISQHRLTIRLERNNQLLPANYRHIYQNAQGNLVHHKNSNTAADPHCYYHGLVYSWPNLKENNDPHNYAILSSCHGLQGIFSFQGEIFRIQPSNPQSTSLNSLHVVSKLNHLNHYHRITRSICNIEEADTSSLVGKEINWKPDLWRQRRILNVNTMYIELVIVNDYQQVQKFKGNLTALEENIFQIVNHLDSIYKSVNIRIGLTGIVSWNIKNPITVTNEARRTLDNFATYKINTLSKLFNLDNAQLLTGLSLNQHSGLAYISTICSPQSVGVVQSYDDNFDATVTVIAHELGHNLGMRHDNNDVCHCQFKPDHAYRCIMSSALTEPPPQTFSSCSLDQLNITIQQGKVDCLFNKPIQVITPPRCGNGLQENGEECDCGSLQECANSCCNATTCKLYDGVQCQSGPCCNQCHFKAFGELCRQSINQCDLPEYCNGQSAACPADVVKQSTTPCDNSSGYCYRGSCLTINRQCKTLWGSTSYPALPICWNTLNIRGDNYGFCKQNGNDYKPCNPTDVYCGALQCNSSADNPVIDRSHKTAKIYFPKNGQNIECKSVTINDANSINMLNHVANGTKCGHDKICINHQCLDINKLTDIIQCLPSNCSGHGVCNSKGHCHCDAGYRPPNCLQPGHGGSIDSHGHAVILNITANISVNVTSGLWESTIKTTKTSGSRSFDTSTTLSELSSELEISASFTKGAPSSNNEVLMLLVTTTAAKLFQPGNSDLSYIDTSKTNSALLGQDNSVMTRLYSSNLVLNSTTEEIAATTTDPFLTLGNNQSVTNSASNTPLTNDKTTLITILLTASAAAAIIVISIIGYLKRRRWCKKAITEDEVRKSEIEDDRKTDKASSLRITNGSGIPTKLIIQINPIATASSKQESAVSDT